MNEQANERASWVDSRRKDAKTWAMSSGKTQYLRYLAGGRLTQRQAIRAKCAECCGGYRDGKVDCRVPACPLYRFMAYREDAVKEVAVGPPALDREGDDAEVGGKIEDPEEA